MSTQRPQPELSAYFIREKRILKAADTAKYTARLKEIDLPDDYAIYGYEPSSGRKPAAYWVCKQSVGECPECGTPYLEDAIASVSESKLTHYCRVAIPHEGEKPTYDIHPATLYLRRIRWMCYNCYSKLKTYNAKMQDDSQLVDEKDRKLTLGQFTRNYTQTVKRAADNKRRYASDRGIAPVCWGVSKGGNAPFGTRLCEAKCSVLYALSALP